MTANDRTSPRDIKPSEPISIPTTARGRARSLSVSSASSGSASSSDIPTPAGSASSQRISIPSPSTSPILSYFLSPTNKTPATATFPFKRKFGTTPVLEAEEEAETEIPVAAHARRASANVANRFSQGPASTIFSDAHTDRGTNLLRRLSLSSAAFVKPQFDTNGRAASPPSPPPNTAVSPTIAKGAPFSNKPRRSATISTDGVKPRRAPSPMGERILKGHFDGFN